MACSFTYYFMAYICHIVICQGVYSKNKLHSLLGNELSGLSWINKKAPGTTFTQGPKKGRQKAKFYLLLNILSANWAITLNGKYSQDSLTKPTLVDQVEARM